VTGETVGGQLQATTTPCFIAPRISWYRHTPACALLSLLGCCKRYWSATVSNQALRSWALPASVL